MPIIVKTLCGWALIREIGLMVATRRKNLLNRALQVARWIFTDGSAEQQGIIANLLLDGLRYLSEELRYDNRKVDKDEANIPLLRWGCVHLALAMSKAGSEYGSDSTVKRWAIEAQEDPLPEVRHAVGPTPMGIINYLLS